MRTTHEKKKKFKDRNNKKLLQRYHEYCEKDEGTAKKEEVACS